ncbi:hypothetical protein PS003_23725, partial [Shigella sonnei]|nr:hypothetical protein [Shigella sonnei]
MAKRQKKNKNKNKNRKLVLKRKGCSTASVDQSDKISRDQMSKVYSYNQVTKNMLLTHSELLQLYIT